MNNSESREDRFVRIFGEVCAAMVQHGLELARRDDPHAFARVAQWKQDVGGTFQLRVDITSDGVTTRGLICDANGEALAEVFTVTARPVVAEH